MSIQVTLHEVHVDPRHRGSAAQVGLYLDASAGPRNTATVGADGGARFPEAELVTFENTLPALYQASLEVRLTVAGAPAGTLSVELSSLLVGESVDAWFALDETDTQASVRLALRLDGPVRPELAGPVAVGKRVAAVVDAGLGMAAPLLGVASELLSTRVGRLAGLSIAPALTKIGLPALALVGFFCFPIVLPLLVIAAAVLFAAAAAAVGLAVASRPGRAAALGLLRPIIRTSVGQRLVYATGERPSLTAVADAMVPHGVWSQLAFSVVLDTIGNASYLLPILGEGGDFAWGPIQAMFVKSMFRGRISPWAHYVAALEEILPFTDILPSCTLCWLRSYGGDIVREYAGGEKTD